MFSLYRDYTVRVGSDNANSGGVVVQVQSLKKSDSYNKETGANDVGVVVLAKPLEFTDSIKAVLIPKKGRAASNIKGPTYVSGYDSNSSVKVVESQVLSAKECKEKFSTEVSKDKACGVVGDSAKCTVSIKNSLRI